MLILGVDPGALRGAYAVLDASGSLLEVADLPKVADHKTRWVDAPVLLSRRLEIKPVATLRRRIPSSIATTGPRMFLVHGSHGRDCRNGYNA
jgi:hypothetical protein